MPSENFKHRKSLLLAASALTSSSLVISEPALAQCAGTPADLTCSPVGNPYASGITNNGADVAPLKITLQPGVVVTIPSGTPPPAAVSASNSSNQTTGSANVTIVADGVTINNAASPGSGNAGLVIHSSGNAIVTATNTTIDAANNHAIEAIAYPNVAGTPHLASINWSGAHLTASGPEKTVIMANNLGTGDSTVVASGNITGTAGVGQEGFYGVMAHSSDSFSLGTDLSGPGNASVTYSSGTLSVFGSKPRGLVVWVQNDGSGSLTTSPGTVITVNSSDNPGVVAPTLPVKAAISLQLDEATAANGRSLTANVASRITTTGTTAPGGFFSNPNAIRTISYVDAPTTLTYTGPGITTHGGGATGIMALSGSGAITVNATGPIDTTDGSSSVGILADSGTLLPLNNGLSTDTQIIHSAVPFATTTGSVKVNATKVSTQGQFGTAISATSGTGGVTISVAQAGSIMGGWQADLAGVGAIYGLPAAGVVLSSDGGTAKLTNLGTIGALSDRAVAGSSQVTNSFTITGFVQFAGGANSIVNDGTFNLRHFADTNGDGVRDKLRVAFADLGDGPDNSFTNNGTLALPVVTGATALDSAGQYLPLGNSRNAMAPGGPLQGHLIGVTRFSNSGTIDLQNNPVAGDVLVITGARQAGLPGTGTFVSNGGTLKLDTVLNAGGAATHSDTLVVDGTAFVTAATSIEIRNAGGAGDLTVGDGILVAEVLDPARSTAGVFALSGGVITAGAFDYHLFKGGVARETQGNWYLRSSQVEVPIEPPIEPPIQPPIEPPIEPPVEPGTPFYQPGVAVMSVVPSLARTLTLVTLGTFNERQGSQQLLGGEMQTAAWGRVLLEQRREHFAQGAEPDFDGDITGLQMGATPWQLESNNGRSDHIGFYGAFVNASGSVHGLVDGVEGAAGHADLEATSIGGYWTRLGPSNWYIDAVAQGTHFSGKPNSVRGNSAKVTGNAFTGSIEAGYPITLTASLTLEPQIQGVWQHVQLDETEVPSIATITFDHANVYTGRVGARLLGIFGSSDAEWQPYLKGNLWWGSNGTDTVTFNDFSVETGRNGHAALEGGAGITGNVARNVSIYGDVSYLESLSGESRSALKGNVSVRVTW